MPIKFKAKAIGDQKPKYTLEEPVIPPDAEAEDHEPDFKIKDFKQNYIKYHFHKESAGPRKARHHNIVHISDLDPARKWCPREPALLTKHKMKRPDGFISTAQGTVFKFGNKGADLVIGGLPPAMVWGNWKCPHCKHELKFTYTPIACPQCKHSKMEYREVFLRDPDTKVVGSVDLFVDLLGNGMKTGCEIKTEGNESFKKRIKPEFDHEWRSMGYLWLMNRDPVGKAHNLNLKEMRVLYITKEGHDTDPKIKEWGLADWGKSPLKEYWVSRNDDMIENQIERAASYRMWRMAFDNGHIPLMPDRIPDCKNAGCTVAKNCPVRKECWK